MRKEMIYSDLIKMKGELKIKTGKDAYGLVCSEKMKEFLFEHCRKIAGMDFQELTILHGLKIKTIETWVDNIIWMFDKEGFENIEKEGLTPLMKNVAMARIND